MLTIFSRLSVYLAAVILFFSWLITNSFVAIKQQDTQTMDAVQSEENQARLFSSLFAGQRATLRELADIEDTLAKLQNEGKHIAAGEQNDAGEVNSNEKWVESFKSNSAQLANNAKELAELAERVQPPDDLAKSIKSTVEGTKDFNAKVQNEANTYKRDAEASPSLEPGQDETNAEGHKKHKEQLDADLGRIAKMEGTFREFDQQVVSLYASMDDHITQRRDRSAEHATIVSIIAYILSVLGTAIGGLGKWLENKNKGNARAAT